MKAEAQKASFRNVLVIGVFAVFCLLGLAIAYNSGATAEEMQNNAISRRIDSVRRRLRLCMEEVSSVEKGRAVTFENQRDVLTDQLNSLKAESAMYTEQNSVLENKVGECEAQLALERKRIRGSSAANVTDEILRLRYQLKNVQAAVDSASATRGSERRSILRLIEAYAKENAVLARRLRVIRNDASQSLNLSIQVGGKQ